MFSHAQYTYVHSQREGWVWYGRGGLGCPIWIERAENWAGAVPKKNSSFLPLRPVAKFVFRVMRELEAMCIQNPKLFFVKRYFYFLSFFSAKQKGASRTVFREEEGFLRLWKKKKMPKGILPISPSSFLPFGKQVLSPFLDVRILECKKNKKIVIVSLRRFFMHCIFLAYIYGMKIWNMFLFLRNTALRKHKLSSGLLSFPFFVPKHLGRLGMQGFFARAPFSLLFSVICQNVTKRQNMLHRGIVPFLPKLF